MLVLVVVVGQHVDVNDKRRLVGAVCLTVLVGAQLIYEWCAGDAITALLAMLSVRGSWCNKCSAVGEELKLMLVRRS